MLKGVSSQLPGNATDGDVLTWDGEKWTPEAVPNPDLSAYVPYTGATTNVDLGANSLTSPLIIGGTSTTDDLVLRTTSGVGTTGSDMIFQGGNNGATEFARFLNNGNFGIGTPNPTNFLHLRKDNLGVLVEDTGNEKIFSIENSAIYTGTTDGYKVVIGSGSKSSGFEMAMGWDTDIANGAAEAFYMAPNVNNTRWFFGSATRRPYSMDFRFIQRFENIPSELKLVNGSPFEGGENSSLVSATGRLALFPGTFTGSITGSARGGTTSSGGMRTLPFKVYATNSDNFIRSAGYIFDMFRTSADWSNPHTIWQNNNETNTLMTLEMNGDFGVGTSPSARIHGISTTEQLRLGYNASNYWNATTGATGITTFNAVGSGSEFIFSDSVRFNGGTKSSDGSAGFTGTGAYTNFTIKDGLITAAS